MRQFVSSYEHRTEQELDIFFFGFYRIHNYLIFSEIGAEFYNVIFSCNDVRKLILIENSSYSIE